MATTKVMTIKLLVNKKANRVLFAEASKDFVDFLFGLLSLPLGSVIDLLTKEMMVGSLGKLYESLENLSSTYIQPNQNKESLLKPKSSIFAVNIPFLPSNMASKCYTCSYGHSSHTYMTKTEGTICPNCRRKMDSEMVYFDPKTSNVESSSSSSSEGGGYVKGLVTYMVMDNLVVMPMSLISSITLLNRFHIEKVSHLEEKLVDLTMNEGLELLRTSLWSSTVLSDSFLEKEESS